jgi:hypothetical protein
MLRGSAPQIKKPPPAAPTVFSTAAAADGPYVEQFRQSAQANAAVQRLNS